MRLPGIRKLECTNWNVAVFDSSLSLDLVITSSIFWCSSKVNLSAGSPLSSSWPQSATGGGFTSLRISLKHRRVSFLIWRRVSSSLLKSSALKYVHIIFYPPKARHQLVYIIDKNQLVFCSCTYLLVGSFLPSSSSSSGGSPWRLRR